MRLPTHRPPTMPGEILLEEFLIPLEITQTEFAKYLGWTITKLNQIVKGKRAVTPETALALQDALGMEAQFWLNAQIACDLWQQTQIHKKIDLHPKMKKAS